MRGSKNTINFRSISESKLPFKKVGVPIKFRVIRFCQNSLPPSCIVQRAAYNGRKLLV